MKPFTHILAILLFTVSLAAPGADKNLVRKGCGPGLGSLSPRFGAAEPGKDPAAELISEFEVLHERIAEAQGAFNHDPFLWEVDAGGMIEVWNRLNRAFPGLHKVREEVSKAHRNETSLPDWLIEEVKAGVEKAIKSGSEDSLHGAHVALSRLQEILNRDLREPPPEKQEQDKKDGKDGKDGKDKKPGEKKPPQPPQHPRNTKKYQPHNKTPPSEQDGAPQEPVSIARIKEPGLSYFRDHIFNMLSKKAGWYTVPVNEAPRLAHSPSQRHELVVSPLDLKGQDAALLVPEGFVPVETKNANGSVWKEPDGNWKYNTPNDSFTVPLVRQGDAARPLSPHEQEIYTSPTGYKLSDWPVELQGEVMKIKEAYDKGKIKSNDAARILTSFIANKYLYAMEDHTGSKDVAEIVNSGVFQCDVAATLACALLRDEFQIPTRIVGGARGHQDPFNPAYSHAIAPSEPHAWIEVADKEGNWHGFDATPIKKERDGKKKDGSSKFQPIPSKDQKKQEPEKKDGEKKEGEKKDGKEKGDEKKDQKGEKGQKGEKKDGKPESGEPQDGQGEGESLEQMIRRKEQDSQGDTSPHTEKTDKSVSELIDEAKQVREKMDKEHEAEKEAEKAEKAKRDGKPGDPHGEKEGETSEQRPQQFEKNDHDIPDDFMKKLQSDNPFVSRLVKKMIAWALDERLDGRGKMERLNRLYAAMGGKHPPATLVDAKKKLIQAAELFSGDYPATDVWLKTILDGVEKRPINDTVDQLTHLHRQLQFTLQFMEDKDATSLRELANEIAKLRRKLAQMKHPDAEKIRLVEELRKGLPGNITRGILDKDAEYLDGTHVGANLKTVGLAKKISDGRDPVLKDFRMISALGPHTDFLVDPVFLPSGGVRNTVFREMQPKPTPKVLMPTTDPRDRKFGLFNLMPDNMTMAKALRMGQAVVLGRRVQVKEPSGYEDVDPEKMTILAVDKSGSMQGKKADFQADYVAALVDKALSDVNPNGKSRHRVFILPFDSDVGTPIEVNTPEEARALLKSRGAGMRKADGGTDIQKVLVKAGGMIAEAQKRPDAKHLSRANVVLCSDGGSSVDYTAVNNAFTTGRGTNEELRIKFGFVAIGETNPDLVKLAKDSSQLGADTGTYIEWANDAIANLQSIASAAPKPKNDFWTDQTFAQAPTDVRSGFSSLRNAAGKYSSSLLGRAASDTQATPTLDWLKLEANELRPDRPDKRPKTHRGTIWAFREVLDAVGPVFSPAERAKLLDRTLTDWRSVVPEQIRTLDNNEIAQILHMLRWPPTGSANIQQSVGTPPSN